MRNYKRPEEERLIERPSLISVIVCHLPSRLIRLYLIIPLPSSQDIIMHLARQHRGRVGALTSCWEKRGALPCAIPITRDPPLGKLSTQQTHVLDMVVKRPPV